MSITGSTFDAHPRRAAGLEGDGRAHMGKRLEELALSVYAIRGLGSPDRSVLDFVISQAMGSVSAAELRDSNGLSTATVGRISELVANATQAGAPRSLHGAEAARAFQPGQAGPGIGGGAFSRLAALHGFSPSDLREGGGGEGAGGGGGGDYVSGNSGRRYVALQRAQDDGLRAAVSAVSGSVLAGTAYAGGGGNAYAGLTYAGSASTSYYAGSGYTSAAFVPGQFAGTPFANPVYVTAQHVGFQQHGVGRQEAGAMMNYGMTAATYGDLYRGGRGYAAPVIKSAVDYAGSLNLNASTYAKPFIGWSDSDRGALKAVQEEIRSTPNATAEQKNAWKARITAIPGSKELGKDGVDKLLDGMIDGAEKVALKAGKEASRETGDGAMRPTATTGTAKDDIDRTASQGVADAFHSKANAVAEKQTSVGEVKPGEAHHAKAGVTAQPGVTVKDANLSGLTGGANAAPGSGQAVTADAKSPDASKGALGAGPQQAANAAPKPAGADAPKGSAAAATPEKKGAAPGAAGGVEAKPPAAEPPKPSAPKPG